MKRLFRSIIALTCAAAACVAAAGLGACSDGDDNNKKPGTGDNGGNEQSVTSHDAQTYKVTGSEDEYTWHNFVDGKCTLCDETTIFEEQPIGDSDLIDRKSQKPGTLTKITYSTRSYIGEELYKDQLNGKQIPMEKSAWVYLPYGYNAEDKNTKYNVLYLLHGNGQNEEYWFARSGEGGQFTPDSNAYTKGYGTENILDYLMEENMAEKTIVVTPTFYSTTEEYPIDKDNWRTTKYFGQELINDLMPYVAKNFNTYAASGSAEDLKAARDHQGYAGLSMGSVTSFTSIWSYCLEYFAYIGSLSAGANSPEGDDFVPEIVEAKNTTYADCDIKYWYVSSGTSENPESKFDTTYIPFIEQIEGLQHGSDIASGDNCEFMTIQGTAHNYATWITDLYNFMQVFFKA